MSMVAAWWRRLTKVALWIGQPAMNTTGVASAQATHSRPSNCRGGTIEISISGTDRATARINRARRLRRATSSSAA